MEMILRLQNNDGVFIQGEKIAIKGEGVRGIVDQTIVYAPMPQPMTGFPLIVRTSEFVRDFVCRLILDGGGISHGNGRCQWHEGGNY